MAIQRELNLGENETDDLMFGGTKGVGIFGDSPIYVCLFISAQSRVDFYGGFICTKFVSLCLFVRKGYF